jgi:ubiquinone/menaquinone biosynthesis C-methylase UbiE
MGTAKPSSYNPIQQYGNSFLGSRSVDKILELYYAGIDEAWRVLKPKGILIVKTKDQIESGKQRYLTVDVINYCTHDAWTNLDRFIVVSQRKPQMRHPYQYHARKNSSEFLLFTKRSTKTSV